jgi:hypothetical protein
MLFDWLEKYTKKLKKREGKREQRLSRVENATDRRIDQALEFRSSLGCAKDTTSKMEVKALEPTATQATELEHQVIEY